MTKGTGSEFPNPATHPTNDTPRTPRGVHSTRHTPSTQMILHTKSSDIDAFASGRLRGVDANPHLLLQVPICF